MYVGLGFFQELQARFRGGWSVRQAYASRTSTGTTSRISSGSWIRSAAAVRGPIGAVRWSSGGLLAGVWFANAVEAGSYVGER